MKRLLTVALAASSLLCIARETAIYQGKLTSEMNANGFAITNVPMPVANGDIANKAYVDAIGGVTPQSVTNIVVGYGYATTNYVDAAVSAATPADYVNVSNRAVNAYQYGEEIFSIDVINVVSNSVNSKNGWHVFTNGVEVAWQEPYWRGDEWGWEYAVPWGGVNTPAIGGYNKNAKYLADNYYSPTHGSFLWEAKLKYNYAGIATTNYVNSAISGVAPADYANVSNKAVNAVQTNNLGSVTFGNDFGAIEYNAPNVEGLENWIKITKNALVEVGENGIGDVWIGSTSGNSQYVNLKIGKNYLWTETDGEYSGLIWDWHTNTYTKSETYTMSQTDAAIWGAVSNRTAGTIAPKFVPNSGEYSGYWMTEIGIHPQSGGFLTVGGWNQYKNTDDYTVWQTLPEYLDSREPAILSSAASDAQSRVDTATKSFTSYSWIRPDDWYVTFSSSNQFPSVTWVGETENDSGQIFSNEVRTVTHSIGGCASWENIDPNSTNYAPVEAWASYDAALTINGNGEFTAASNGLYRISAKRGNDYRYADVAAQILPAEVTTNMIYMRDAAASARKSVNDAAKTILQNATLVSSAGYNTYNTFKYHMTGAAAGNVKPFAVSAHVLVGASHYAVKPTGYQYFNDGNGHSANVYKLPWVSLSDWAATNGFSQVEISEANINDLYMIPCDKSTAVPDGCIPWFMSEYTAKEKFGSTMIGLQAWFAPQDHEYAVPCVLSSINGIAMRYSPSYYTEPLTRADICPILRDMGTQYQIKGGDSGRPMWINIDNKPVVLCGFHFGGGGSAGGGGENLMRGFNIIKAFVEWYGDTIKEYK